MKKCKECGQDVPKQKTGWWHWFIEICPKCNCNLGAMPIKDDLGEDCNLFAKVDNHNSGRSCKCSCGAVTRAVYRHALADWNCITAEDGMPLYKRPLMTDQKEGQGTFMTETEYAIKSASLAKRTATR